MLTVYSPHPLAESKLRVPMPSPRPDSDMAPPAPRYDFTLYTRCIANIASYVATSASLRAGISRLQIFGEISALHTKHMGLLHNCFRSNQQCQSYTIDLSYGVFQHWRNAFLCSRRKGKFLRQLRSVQKHYHCRYAGL